MNKGTKHSEATRLKMRLNHKGMSGKHHSRETIGKISSSQIGKFVSIETRLKLSKSLTGRKLSKEHIEKSAKGNRGKVIPLEVRKKMGESRRGIKLSKEHIKKLTKARTPEWRRKMSFLFKGEKSHFWKGGITDENEIARKSAQYNIWRKSVFERDNWTCQECGQVGGRLHADHIRPWAYFKELRFDINNGRTLCVECHKKTETYGGRILKTYGKIH